MSNVIPFPRVAKKSTEWLQLHLELLGIEPRIWRRVVVPESIRVGQLHQVIQVVFGWMDSHLHEFDFDGERFGVPDPDFDDIPIRSERRVQLKSALGPLRSFTYIYDFGDDWTHKIKVERRISGDVMEEGKVICIGGENATPPENVGGAPGYAEFLRVIADASDPEHEAMKSWVGFPFDPRLFDIEQANKFLRKVRVSV